MGLIGSYYVPVSGERYIVYLWFRLDETKVVHDRHVYQFLQWPGNIGGMFDLLIQLKKLFLIEKGKNHYF